MNLLILVNFFLLVVTFTVHESAASLQDQWKDFKIKFSKSYKSPEEEAKRFEVFKENCEFIQKHNENAITYKVGVNRDADQTREEISKRLQLETE